MSVPPRMVSAAVVSVVLVAVAVNVTTTNADLADACYLGVMVAASAAAWVGVGRWPRGRRRLPVLVASGISLTALGDVLWTALDRAGADTDASVADIAWFASYVVLCAALWTVLSRSRATGRADVDFVVDAATIVAISVLVFWTLSVEAIVADSTLTPFVRAVWAAYPVMDAILLALVLRVVLSRRARATVDGWFGVGVCLWLAADILYLYVQEGEVALDAMDAAWMVAPVLMARAAWRVRDPAPAPAGGRPTNAGWVAGLGLAVLPLAVPPVLDVLADLRGQGHQPLQLVVGTVVVMVLAFVRTGRLIQSEQRARRELEVARDAALEAAEAKSMFLANISHEIRTPLTTVLAAAGLLGRTSLDAAQLKLLERMTRSGGQLRALVEGLLDFSRLEAGRADLQREEFDLRAVMTDVVDTHLPGATRKGVTLNWAVDPRVPQVVVGDRTRVFQVLDNLVENALKFTSAGNVRLTADPYGGEEERPAGVQMCVVDTGIGIRDEDQGRIFESFTQVDGSVTRSYQGTGLGLAICKEIIELMDGTITVHSRLGTGSTFTVRLPLLAPAVDGRARTSAETLR